jgi:phosphoglycerate dehydrogenase-like enzyme
MRKINKVSKVAVCSRSFSKNKILRKELQERYLNITFNDDGLKLEGSSLINFLRGHDKAIIALERINESILRQLPELKVVSKYGVGLDMIDIDAMKKYRKRLGWSGGVNRRSVSEMVVSLAISMLRHIFEANREVVSGVWRQRTGRYLSGCTVGIIGCGFIGKDLVKLLKPFNCKILVYDIKNYSDFYEEHDIVPTSLDDLLKLSDVVTLHLPLDGSTRNILNKDKLRKMKSDSVLINMARGGLVDEKFLKEILKTGQILSASLDVFDIEPPNDKELLQLTNFIATPHIGGSANEAILAMGKAAIDGLDSCAM